MEDQGIPLKRGERLKVSIMFVSTKTNIRSPPECTENAIINSLIWFYNFTKTSGFHCNKPVHTYIHPQILYIYIYICMCACTQGRVCMHVCIAIIYTYTHLHTYATHKICDWANENEPGWHKLHIIIKTLISWVPYNILIFCKL